MRRAVLATFALCVGSAFGCNSILGLDNFRVTDGAGGAGATGGVGGAGSGGVPACGDVLTPNKNVVRTCVLRSSCSPFIENATISTCITLNLQQAFLGNACTANAMSCSDVELCDGYGHTTPQQCSSGQSGWRCENNVAINCSQGYYVSCAKRGGTCVMYDSNGDFINDAADCQVVSSCATGDSGCQGEIAYTCVGGVGYGAVCSNFGAQCSVQNGQPTCFLATQACTGTLPPCDGDTAQVCVNGRKARYDCASVGLHCASDASGPYCVAPGCTLADANKCAESCTGSIAHLCYGGVPFDVDCKTYGFATCHGADDKAPPQGIGHYVVCGN